MRRREFLITAAAGARAMAADPPVVAAARGRLRDYWESAALPAAEFVLGDFSLLERHGLKAPRAPCPESFVIAPVGGKLLVCGASATGIKRGVYRLMQEAAAHGRAPQSRIESAPFIEWRGSHLGGYTRRVFGLSETNAKGASVAATPAQLDWNRWERWPPERAADYVDLLDFFGYNLLETSVIPFTEANSSEAVRRRDLFHERVRRNGMRQSLQFKGTLMPPGGSLPYGPETRSRYEEYYRKSAEAAAPYLDSVLTHWVDAGGWKSTPEHPCTIELLQDLHMKIHAEFRRVNPRIESILSVWNLDSPSYRWWTGYSGVETILSSGKIPPEVGLAMSRMYRPEEARRITAAGHKAGVWGWYLADNELVYTMHVHTQILRAYLRAIPDEARELCNFHTLSNCQAETNLYSIYVGARMLWDPRQDPEIYLREVARLVYGPKLEEPVFLGLKAIADVRCGKRCRGWWSKANMSLEHALRQSGETWEAVRDLQ